MMKRVWSAALIVFFVALVPAVVWAVPNPLVTLDAPDQPFPGESFTFTVTFDNNGTTPGYGPFIDVILPTSGADGSDGATFVGAAIGLLPLTDVTLRTFPAGGCVTHPFAVALNNAPTQVCGTPGDTLIVIRLPFGSFVVDQPPVEVEITAQMSPNADIGLPLSLRARGGFQFGTDELNNPCCDPTLVTPATPDSSLYPTVPVTPIAFQTTKRVITREVASGENFPQQFVVTVDIPAGRTINNLVVTDAINPLLTYVGSSATPASCTTSFSGGVVTATCGNITGTASNADVVLTIDVLTENILNGGTGITETINNVAQVNGDFVTTDPGDGATVSATGGANAPVFASRSIAVQKNAVVVGGGAAQPGAVLEYTVDFQVSDYFAFANAVICDQLSDGQAYDPSFTPRFSLNQHDVTFAPANMTAANFTAPPALPPTCAPGADIEFRVADEMVTRGVIASGWLLGGCIAELTPIPPPDCSLFNSGTEGRIVYRTIIQDSYSSPPPSGELNLDQGDILTNLAVISANLILTGSTTPSAQVLSDDGDTITELARGTLVKDIFAYNGSTVLPPTPFDIVPGDLITFRLRYTLPTSDVEDLVLRDYLPIPVLDVTDAPAFSFIGGAPDASIPPENTVEYGPTDTLNALRTPTLTLDPVANALVFTYGDIQDAGNVQRVVDLLFTVQVQDRPFAGSLSLANVAEVSESSSQLNPFNAYAFAGFNFPTPVLVTRKGVVSGITGGTFDPPITAPVPFPPPGTVGPPFSGIINSDNLGTIPIDSDVDFAAPGDIFRFAIVIENIGGGGAFDITVRDIIPPGFIIPSGGLNLTIVRGDGTPLTFVALNPSDVIPLFGAGIQIVDPAGNPACQQRHPTNGTNVAVITYDLQIDPNVQQPVTLTNQVNVANFAAREAAANLVQDAAAFTNGASVGVGMAANTGAGGGTSGTSGSTVLTGDARLSKRADPAFARPGDAVTWTIEVNNPAPIPMSNIRVSDTLPPQLELISSSASAGQVSINDLQITWTLGSLPPGGSATMTIQTRVRSNPLPAPYTNQQASCTPGGQLFTENIACLQYDGGAQVCTTARTLCVSQLPQTGFTPHWREPLLWGAVALLLVTSMVGIWWVLRWQRMRAPAAQRMMNKSY